MTVCQPSTRVDCGRELEQLSRLGDHVDRGRAVLSPGSRRASGRATRAVFVMVLPSGTTVPTRRRSRSDPAAPDTRASSRRAACTARRGRVQVQPVPRGRDGTWCRPARSQPRSPVGDRRAFVGDVQHVGRSRSPARTADGAGRRRSACRRRSLGRRRRSASVRAVVAGPGWQRALQASRCSACVAGPAVSAALTVSEMSARWCWPLSARRRGSHVTIRGMPARHSRCQRRTRDSPTGGRVADLDRRRRVRRPSVASHASGKSAPGPRGTGPCATSRSPGRPRR